MAVNSTVPDNSVGRRLRDWLTLHEVGLATYQLRHPPQEDFALFQRVLAAAQAAVSFWNGSLVFVYLPMQGNVSPAGTVRSVRSRRIRDEVLRICAALSIPVLDIEKRFLEEPARLRDYFYPYHAHFTEKGYRRAGELVLDELSRQSLLQSAQNR